MTVNFSSECLEVLRALSERRNVLISGPPASGKSRLLAEVALAFEAKFAAPTPSSGPVLVPGAAVPIPDTPPTSSIDPELQKALPSGTRSDRKVFRTVFHQNSKYREFLTGLAPSLSKPGAFEVTNGILFRASEHAKTAKGVSLLIIDEINRGPAVQVFGGAIVAIEPEKRLGADGSAQYGTQYFELLDPTSGQMIEYAFPHHLYILGAMNQADVSVEPLDVAFLRRWAPYSLGPDEAVLRTYFGLTPQTQPMPSSPVNAQDVYEAVVQAWAKVNGRIALGRVREFQIGHGIVMAPSGTAPTDLHEALALATRSWNAIRAHLDEVFFGDMRGLAVALNATGQTAQHPYNLQEVFFGDEPKQQLTGPAYVTPDNVFAILAAVAE
ncbi:MULTISPECIES: AAA family ATPase [Alphaproteobacteria]|uniref:AAA family ATPase n=1 Tax=Alphaproteobacteria TaxID=28211 RepID=UPI0032976FF2